MKLKAFIKLLLKRLVREAHIYIISFAIFPIVLSAMYGYFQKELFSPSNEMNKINIYIKDEDNSSLSKGLNDFLVSDNMKQILEINKDKEKAKFEVIIPKGYEESAISSKDFQIKVNQKDDKAKYSAAIISSIIDKYNGELQQQVLIKNKINEMNLSNSEKEELLKKTSEKIYAAYGANAIKNSVIPEEKALSSFQYYSVSIFSFMFIVSIMSLVGDYYKEKETGIFNRIISSSLSKLQYFNYSLVTFFIFAIIINTIYILTYRLTGLSFKGSPMLLILIIIAKSLLEASVAGIVIAFFKQKKHALLFLQLFIMLAVTLGGAFVPMDRIASGIILKLNAYIPNVLIINVFKNFLLYNSFSSIKGYLAIFILMSIALYGISIMKIRLKWEG